MLLGDDHIFRLHCTCWQTYSGGTLTPGVIKWGKSMRNKKRILLIIGVILFFGAAVAFGISRWASFSFLAQQSLSASAGGTTGGEAP